MLHSLSRVCPILLHDLDCVGTGRWLAACLHSNDGNLSQFGIVDI